MSAPESIVEAQAEALLRRVAREQESRCRRARDAAEEQARSIVARAWEEARARLRAAVDEERRAIDKALADRRAALETVERRKEQSLLRELLDEAWRDLPGALEAMWQQEDGRRDWCEAACELAAQVLHTGSAPQVEVDAAAPADVEGFVVGGLGPAPDRAIEWRRVRALGAGLRIRVGRACLDATVAGLLSSRERVEAELLAELERLLERQDGH